MVEWYAVLPMRDCVDTAEPSVSTVLEQSVPPTKCIVIDDGSTDGTNAILAGLVSSYNNLEIIRTDSRTRDYARIPKLINMGIAAGGPAKYHFIGNGDMTYTNDYVRLLLDRMEMDHDIVLAGGHIHGTTPHRSPRGSGRMVREPWLFSVLGANRYPEDLTFEAVAYWYAKMHGKKVVVISEALCEHHVALGHYHGFGNWGAGMRALGYHPLYAISRCIILRRPNMLYRYLTFRSKPGTHYQSGPPELRHFIRRYQTSHIAHRVSEMLWRQNRKGDWA